jgi:hypothetical protein
MLIQHMVPLLMGFCLALGLWVRLPILAAASLTTLGFFVLGMQWHLPVEPDWIDLWGRTLFDDAFQAFCLVALMALLLERIGWAIDWVDVINEWLGWVGMWALAALLLLVDLALFFVESTSTALRFVEMGHAVVLFLAMVIFLPYAVRTVFHLVAQPSRTVAVSAGLLLLFYLLDQTLGTPLLAIAQSFSVCLTLWLRKLHLSRFMGPPKPPYWSTDLRAVQAVTGATVLTLCLWLIGWAAQHDAASISPLGQPYTTVAVYTSAPLAMAALHLMAARRSIVLTHSRWFRGLMAFTPAYLQVMALSLIYMGLLTVMESVLFAMLFLTGLVLIRGQFSGRVFVQVLLRWAYFVLTYLVMLWFFFPVLDAWMNYAAG